ncbi:hypothetical protein RSOLAG1IB_03222 [Rhizoctonia solani AG-1 IB]|uniref:RBR-type E3 ubiquitin transferase n=1 Tax=Thanatephorus cucumeris (strain AG1-IB / isolate 7/3/14) TaxID=1108050 RepID=A0A0B7FQU9_THACB|nr:hypothetical protein RSOLAG1IB_03222 [Rhizoctonia solani AG-1 IB]
MAALVSENWTAGRSLDGNRYGQVNRQPHLARAPRISPRAADPWLGGQNSVATDVVINNPAPTNTNSARNTRKGANASRSGTIPNNAPKQNAAAARSTQSQPQGRNRNRNRNRNQNNDQNEGSQARNDNAHLGLPNAQPTPSHGRRSGPNNQGGRRQNPPNRDASSNLTTDPVTGEVISKRAAKRRRAKAKKAAAVAREARVEQAKSRQQSGTQTRAVPPSASTSRAPPSGVTPATVPIAPRLPGRAPAPPASSTSRDPVTPNTQPHLGIRPVVTTNTSINHGAVPSTPRSPATHNSFATNLPRIDRPGSWRDPLDQTPRTGQSTVSTTGVNNSSLSRPSASPSFTRQAHVVPSVSLGSRNLPSSSLNPHRAGTATTSSTIATPSTSNRTATTRVWVDPGDSDNDSDEVPPLIQPVTRSVRVPAAPSVVRPALVRIRPSTPCMICFDIPREFPQQRPTTRCTHPINICGSCLGQHISHAVLSQGSTTLTCPDPLCRQNLEYADVIRATKGSRACQDRYETLLLRRTLEAEPNFVWCKNSRCNWGQVHESGASAPIVICQVCQARSCFTHNVPWHTGLTCSQYAVQHANRERENQASEAYISIHAKQCPNTTCGRRIEKNDGCDHMTCRRPAGCGHEFCWVCLADYQTILREGNHRHTPTCRYYAPIRRTTENYLREYNHPAYVPPQRPIRPQARYEPPPPPELGQQTQREQGTGSVWGWLLGAVVAGFMLRG